MTNTTADRVKRFRHYAERRWRLTSVRSTLAFDLTYWKLYFNFVSAGWLENHVVLVVGPLRFTMGYYLDPAAAREPNRCWIEFPRPKTQSQSGNAHIG